MLAHRDVCSLWLLLLLNLSGSAMKFNLHRKDPAPQEGDLRLSGSETDSEGRVEVYHEGKWGTVCDDGWDMAEAQVACRQLHFPGAKAVVVGKDYGQASGPIWLDDIKCEGTENQLVSCSFQSWGVTDCSHKEDVGVICERSGNQTNLTSDESTYLLDHSISLSYELGQIFDSGVGCDFEISVQSTTGNKQANGTPELFETTICAHKIILSQFPHFNTSEEANSMTVEVSQSCHQHFTSLIRYLYTRKVDVNFSSVQCLHWMASQFGIKQLMQDAGRLFSKIIPEDTSFHTQVSLYQYAEETGDWVLKELCLQYMAWNYQSLTMSPAWPRIPVELLRALLVRSDLVVPDEYFLLETLEGWITDRSSSINSETQADLLGRVRFPMIPIEKVYDLESNSSLYSTHKLLYNEKILKAFQFSVLLFSNLQSSPKFKKEEEDFQPRIYTDEPWSTTISSLKQTSANPRYTISYRNGRRYEYDNLTGTVREYSVQSSKSFSTPVHNSLSYRDKMIQWEANVLNSQQECSNRGLRCESIPAARFASQSNRRQPSYILFRNRLLLMCGDKYICQVQDFKNNMAYIAADGTHGSAYPCPDGQFIYRFVVRPEYV